MSAEKPNAVWDFTLPEINNSALHAGIASPRWNSLEKQLAKELLRYRESALSSPTHCSYCDSGDLPLGHLYHLTDDGRPTCRKCVCAECQGLRATVLAELEKKA